MIDEKHYDELWSLIKNIKVAMLVSHDGSALRSRPMHMVQDEFNGKLWFFTDTHSEKVDEVILNNDVCLAFSNPEDDCYVSLSGTAELSRDKALIEEMWNPFVAAWFPEGKDAPNVGLIEVTAESAEIWDADKAKMVQLYEFAKANLSDTKPDLGINRKFG